MAEKARYSCAECGGPITVADDLITVSIDGHAKPAHRNCPPAITTDSNGEHRG